MLKRLFESYLLLSRWLLAPFLAILTFALFGLVVKAGKKAWSLVALLAEGQDQHVTLAMLNLDRHHSYRRAGGDRHFIDLR